MASPDSDPGTSVNPLDAKALAPADALIGPKPTLPAAQSETKPADAPAVEKTDKEGAGASPKRGPIKPTCRKSLGEVREGDCIRVRVRVRPLRAVNEPPPIAAVPIGHRDDPAVLPPPPSAPVENSPSLAVPPEKPSARPSPDATIIPTRRVTAGAPQVTARVVLHLYIFRLDTVASGRLTGGSGRSGLVKFFPRHESASPR
jgi:hypothetical protein